MPTMLQCKNCSLVQASPHQHCLYAFLTLQVVAGQTAALALKKVKRNQVRKGMVLVDERAKPKASWEFDADIAILTHSTTIQPRYQVCCRQNRETYQPSLGQDPSIGYISALARTVLNVGRQSAEQ